MDFGKLEKAQYRPVIRFLFLEGNLFFFKGGYKNDKSSRSHIGRLIEAETVSFLKDYVGVAFAYFR